MSGDNIYKKGGPRVQRAFTLLEMSVVIAVITALIGVSMFAVGSFKEWKKGSAAGQELRKVYNAQRTYLAEHPTETSSSLTAAKVIPYLSDGATSLPTIQDLDGNTLTIKVDVIPPVINNGSGAAYDPSGKSDDGLWDVGGD